MILKCGYDKDEGGLDETMSFEEREGKCDDEDGWEFCNGDDDDDDDGCCWSQKGAFVKGWKLEREGPFLAVTLFRVGRTTFKLRACM